VNLTDGRRPLISSSERNFDDASVLKTSVEFRPAFAQMRDGALDLLFTFADVGLLISAAAALGSG
jgi:hypothetical protein